MGSVEVILMNDNNDQNVKTPHEVVDEHRSQNAVPRSYNPQVSNAGLEKTLEPNVDDLQSDTSQELSVSSIDIDGNGTFENDDNRPAVATGLVYTEREVITKPWFWVIIASVALFLFLLLIIIVFLLKNSDGLNYVSTSYLDSEEYRKIYMEVESVVSSYQTKYGVTVDKYLIISALTAYKNNDEYMDNTDSTAYDYISVEDDEESSKNITEMRNYIEILAKYQIKTNASCSYDSSSMRKIASNDDATTLLNFWTSAAAKEKNYDCSGSGSSYSISVDEGNIKDDNSGSVFYWNLVDESFLSEYYSKYFDGIPEESYLTSVSKTIEYIYLYAKSLKDYDTTVSTRKACNGTAFFWPIGSKETTTRNGKVFATGEPDWYDITQEFGEGGHKGMDIAAYLDTNVIASKAGIVKATGDYSDYVCDTGDNDTYGWFVKIEHSDGTYTLYAHMKENSVSLEIGDEVEQGQVIGKVGLTGCSSGPHLHFEVFVTSSQRINPREKVKEDEPRPSCDEFSLNDTSLSKQEFVTLMHNYCTSSGNKAFCTDFSPNAELIYDVSLQNNVNPELVVVTARSEMSFQKCAGYYNYWGLGISNGEGCSAGEALNSMEAGIKKYAEYISTYSEGGSLADMILGRYNAREAAGCDSAGHGLPGTLAGMQSVYSWLGNYRFNPGSSGLGGCHALKIVYNDENYCNTHPSCTSYNSNSDHNCPDITKTTTCEQNDYTAWQIKQKLEFRKEMFGI